MINRFFLLLLFISSFLNAENFISTNKITNLEINKIFYLKDQNYKINDLDKKTFTEYTKKPNELFKFPFENKSSYWIKFNISNKSTDKKNEVIYISYPDIRSVSFYEKTTSNGNFKIINGDGIKDRVFSSKLILEKNEKKTILIKIENELAPIIFNLQILDDHTFHKKEKQILTIHSIFTGMMIFAMIYFLIAFILIKKYIYILYVIHIFGFVTFQVFIQGYPKIYTSDLLLLDQIKISMALLAACSYALFVLYFLKDSLHKIYKYAIYIVIVAVFVSMILYLNDKAPAHILSAFGLIEYLIVLIGSISAYKKGNPYALNIFISSLILILGAIFHSFAIIFQVIPLYEYTLYSISYTNILEVLIILFMFVTYFKKTYEEKEHIYLEKLNLEKSFSKNLEKEVELKTLELQKAKIEAENLARIDELTKLFNRRAFMEEAEYLIKEAKRYKTPLTLVLLDIDHFKKINDTYGHEAGDIVLQRFSNTLSSCVRETDIVARIGGEEFVIIFPHTDLELILNITNKIKQNINELEINYKNENIKITSSFGISKFNQIDDDIKSILARADEALYRAKNTGRNKIEVQK